MNRIFMLLLALFVGVSCATQEKILYLQNNQIDTPIEVVKGGEIRLQPNDEIKIYVASKNPELAAIFNLQSLINNTSSTSGSNSSVSYTVSKEGNIDFPVLGSIEVEGLTRQELVTSIKQKIIDSGMLKDPVVIVEFGNLTFSTLGEVGSPGVYSISKEQTTILDAISQAGDLTITGLRDRVFLTRSVEGKLITYQLDLRSTDIYKSPAYYVQQNDVIYVEPNKVKTNSSTINGNTLRSASFWMSLTSFLMSLTTFFIAF